MPFQVEIDKSNRFYAILKFLLISLNIISFICGLCLIILGSLFYYRYNSYEFNQQNNLLIITFLVFGGLFSSFSLLQIALSFNFIKSKCYTIVQAIFNSILLISYFILLLLVISNDKNYILKKNIHQIDETCFSLMSILADNLNCCNRNINNEQPSPCILAITTDIKNTYFYTFMIVINSIILTSILSNIICYLSFIIIIRKSTIYHGVRSH
jgi:4-amino-4-deoxy-L-arabinose transferase-like glycosyltransferase